jgi:hypothetical protein
MMIFFAFTHIIQSSSKSSALLGTVQALKKKCRRYSSRCKSSMNDVFVFNIKCSGKYHSLQNYDMSVPAGTHEFN